MGTSPPPPPTLQDGPGGVEELHGLEGEDGDSDEDLEADLELKNSLQASIGEKRRETSSRHMCSEVEQVPSLLVPWGFWSCNLGLPEPGERKTTASHASSVSEKPPGLNVALKVETSKTRYVQEVLAGYWTTIWSNVPQALYTHHLWVF